MSDLRPRRSALYMPGANDKALEKAKTLPTDAIIFDTEDSVAPDMKESAREKVAAAVASGEYGNRELTIRVNSLETQWSTDDLRSAAQAGPSGIVVPKINSAADVAEVERLLRTREEARAKKDWKEADRLRAELGLLGVTLQDTAEGSTWTL